ncbi:hypothetical protein P3L51_21665 [Streptomyces sp. PSRA5]|uniref:hypothetical protein n=1 Tax=Streptomyces panacea TaxID=3035064 RepID=UPI00339BD865
MGEHDAVQGAVGDVPVRQAPADERGPDASATEIRTRHRYPYDKTATIYLAAIFIWSTQ